MGRLSEASQPAELKIKYVDRSIVDEQKLCTDALKELVHEEKTRSF
jgi:hypothetical protein